MNVYSHKYREDEWKSFDQDFVKAIFNGDKLVAFWWVSFLEQLLQEIIVFVGQSLIICNYIQKKKWWRTFASYDFCEDFLLFVENESGSLKQEFYTKYFTNSCNRNMVQHAKFGDQFSFQFTPWTLCLSKTKQLLNKISKERGINNKNMDSQRIQPRRDWCKDCFSQFKSQ